MVELSKSKLKQYAYSCIRKIKYDSEPAAWIGVLQTVTRSKPQRNTRRILASDLTPYYCIHCQHWHIGHLSKSWSAKKTHSIRTHFRLGTADELEKTALRDIESWAWEQWWKSKGTWKPLVNKRP